jgi:tetratricopeptide (TPR) repeat protein
MRIRKAFQKTINSVLFAASFLGTMVYAQVDSLSLAPSIQNQSSDSLVVNTQRVSIIRLESDHGPYDYRLKEALTGLGSQLRSEGKFSEARSAYSRALQICRVNDGLISSAQINIVQDLIELDYSLGNWQAVNDRYIYLEHLYKRLYKVDDPRLEEGLRKIVAWHIGASNINLGGNRLDHLRKVHSLFKLRLEVAELTLPSGDPFVEVLKNNIKRSEYSLYMASDLNREIRQNRRKPLRETYLVTTE